MDSLSETVRIKAAASMLGVTPQTVRNWVSLGRLPAVRHPMNGYRLFRIEDINQLIASVGGGFPTGNPANTDLKHEASSGISYAKCGGAGVRSVTLEDGRTITSALPSKARARGYAAIDYELEWLRSSHAPEQPSLGRRVRVGDAFSGGGIFSLGVDEALRAVGMAPVHAFGLDFDSEAISTFRHNFPTSVAIHKDVRCVANGEVGTAETVEERQFLEVIGGGVDILVAGPPCQGHSDLNNHTRRQDPKNSLYFSTVRLAELLQPRFVLIENVPGVVHDKNGVVKRTADALADMGFAVTSSLVDLKQIGVPQTRKRFVLVASRKGAVDIDRAIEMHKSDLRPVSWAIGDLTDAYDAAVTYSSSASHSVENRRRIDFLFDQDIHELPNTERPPCHRDKVHSYMSVYGRMFWDRPAPTITGGFGSTGQGRFVHPLFRRTLTPHEACRLQFVPDYFQFPSSTGRRAMQQIIGNAAPPKLSQAIVLGAAIQGVLL